MERIVSLCKRRGFVFQSSDIYGGFSSCYDYGPLGVELKRNVKDAWWQSMVTGRDDIVGLDSAIIQHPEVWKSSGHLEGFHDMMVDCKECKGRFREDHLEDRNKCPNCGAEGMFTEARAFNLMFKTFAGPVESTASAVFLRPETAQGIFTNFLNVVNSSRVKPPFGIAQIGKSFRNEITPGNFVFRTREFEQMEMEYFIPPGEDDKWYEYWIQQRFDWYVGLGVRPEKLRKRAHADDELAHYSTGCTDVEYRFPWGFDELEGIAKRGCFDLTQHSKGAGKDLSFFDEATKERYIPHVVEPAAGCDRTAMTFLVDAYEEEVIPNEKTGKEDVRTVLRFHPKIAPITVAVFPLVKKEGMPDKAREIVAALQDVGLRTFYDEKGAIGRRYRRQDEVGTPWCVTVDGDTLADGTVTVRDRDSMTQERIAADEIVGSLKQRVADWKRG
ncbi:MAG: glycine--tRNA ligase [Planctomycetes bacterium]|nr:glycine--tRNA ligase [Planctomycetota bacterium]